MKKNGIKNKLSLILIVAGLIVILIPVLISCYKSYQQDKMYEDYLINEKKHQTNANSDIITIPTDGAVDHGFVFPTYENGEILGRLKIPVIDVDMLLVEGVEDKNLSMGAGHFPSNPLPDQPGNCAIAGHRGYTFGTYLYRLDEVKIGDEIIVEYKDKEYKYEVYEILTVLPTDVSVLYKPKEDVSIVTLVTCTPVYNTTHRLIVHGKLISDTVDNDE